MNYHDEMDKKFKERGVNKDIRSYLHHHLCEIMPSVCEDSGQAEWSTGELDEFLLEALDILIFHNVITPPQQSEEGV